jgi:D-alanine--poly(phosphoribitol) ligase subunit 1
VQINVLEYFLQTLERLPQKVACADRNGPWTFDKLAIRSASYAHAILRSTSAQNQPIAVYLPKGTEAVASFLAILMSGNCYAPLDTKAPPSRSASVLTDLNPPLILTSASLAAVLSGAGVDPEKLLVIDGLAEDRAPWPDHWQRVIDTDPVYILHTSGSTGRPKGVVVSHRSVIDYIDWARECFAIDEQCVIGNQAPFIFDNSTLDLYLAFATGATLNLIPDELFLFPVRLLEYLAVNEVTFLFWVPSIMVSVANKGALDQVPGLRLNKVLFAGEVMPARHLNMWRSRFPAALFANLYGPTEVTVDCTYHVIDEDLGDEEPVPIGRPCRNSDVFLLNDQDALCGTGERGEICVRGTSLALGYWNQPEATAAAFVQNPLNPHVPERIYRTGDVAYWSDRGDLIFVGRKDLQIKHMGYRIELGEIEGAALHVRGIRNGCALYDVQKKELLLVYEADRDIPSAQIRDHLGQSLPKYMLPTVFRRLLELPRTSNGKIDRQRLSKEHLQ